MRFWCLSKAMKVRYCCRVPEQRGDAMLKSGGAFIASGGHSERSNFPPFACSFLIFPPIRRLSDARGTLVISLTRVRRSEMYKYWRKCEETPQALLCQQTHLLFFSMHSGGASLLHLILAMILSLCS